MSVATRNPFALLNDDDVGEPTPSAPSSAPVAPEPKAPAKDQKLRSGPASRGGKYYPRAGGAKNVARDSQDNDAESTPRDRKTEVETRGRGRGGRGGRGRGGPGGGRGRQYDRHSGTLPDSDKKVNQGWGANEGVAELDAEQQGDADAAKDATGDNWGIDANPGADNTWGADATAPAADAGDAWGGAAASGDNAETKDAAGATTDTRRPAFREEEEDNSLTLDEYLAQKAKNEALAVPKIEGVRKANEGADESLWKDTVPLSKAKEQDNYFVGKTKSAPKARTKKEEKVHIEIDARFERPDRGRGRGGRGGRGGERGGERGTRGGRGRGGGAPRPPRDNNANSRDVDVDDQAAFPSLA